jgi:hypothetical protein
MRHGPPALFALVIVAGLGAASSSVRSSAEDIQGVRDEPVTFRSADATLSGTLFLPAGGDRHPAVLLFRGSGPQPRNSFMAHWVQSTAAATTPTPPRGLTAQQWRPV